VIEGELTMDDKDSAMQIAQWLYTELELDTLASTDTSKQARRQAQNDRNEADKSHYPAPKKRSPGTGRKRHHMAVTFVD